MTDNTMREGKLWAFLHDSIHEAYKKLSTTGTSNEYHALLDSIASKVADDVDARFLQAAQSVPVVGEADCYDAGLLSDFGGGNVAWWQDYIRAELARAHDFYVGQSAPEVVPIVSKTVGYLAGGTLMRRKIQGYNCKPLIVQPTTSITAAELERLRKDAARGRMLIEHGEWIRRNHDTDEAHALLAIRLPYDADLSCKAMRENAIDAAIAQEPRHD